MEQIIYILENEAMPGFIKIGFTNGSLKVRLKQLDRTNIPLPFEVYYACRVENAQKDEKWLHKIFSDRRARSNREFFKMSPERVVIALERIQEEEVSLENLSVATQNEQKEINIKKKTRADFNFETYQVPVGSEISFSRDESIKAKVLPNTRIELNGKTTSLSKSAQELLEYKSPVAGTLYWIYEGEILDERRRRMDEEKSK